MLWAAVSHTMLSSSRPAYTVVLPAASNLAALAVFECGRMDMIVDVYLQSSAAPVELVR